MVAFAGNITGLYLVFRSPTVQSWLVSKATTYLSTELNTKVHIGNIDISWFMDVVLDDLLIEDQYKHTLVKSSAVRIDISKIDIKRRHLKIDKVSLDNAEINLLKHITDSTFNYTFIVNYFTTKKAPTAKAKPWIVELKGVSLSSARLRYSDEHKPHYFKLMDYNHLLISSINLDVKNIAIAGDSIKASIVKLAADEKSGLQLHNLSGNLTIYPTKIIARDLHIMTQGSDLQTDLQFSFKNLRAFNSFIDSVRIDALFRPSSLDLNELRFFISSMTGMENLLYFDGSIRGKISSLKARQFHLSFGNSSSFDGDITMDGLPNFQETFMNIKVRNLSTDYYDLTNIRLPGEKKLTLPEEIKRIGLVDVKGYFTGFFYDFVSSADFTTSIGKLETDLSLQTGRGKLLKYGGQFNLKQWDLGKTFDVQGKVGKIDFSSSINGEILDSKHNSMSLDAVIESVVLLKNEFNGITINGQLINRLFNGNLCMNDELANLDFAGIIDFSDSIPRINCTATLEDAYLSRLNLWERDSSSRISTTMDLNFTGSNIDNLMGYLRFDHTTYSENGKDYYIKAVELNTVQISRETKKLALKSDFVDASFYGLFSFADFYHSLSNIISSYMPSLQLTPMAQQVIKKNQMFEYSIQLKNIEPLCQLFVPDLSLKSEASIFGSYDSKNNNIVLNGLADEFLFKGVRFNNWYVRGKNTGASLQLITGVSSIILNESVNKPETNMGMENFVFKTFMQGDSVKFNLDWDDVVPEDINTGHINGYLSFSDFPKIHGRFNKFDVMINNKAWSAKQNEDLIIDSTSVFVDNMEIFSSTQKLRLSGKISENPEDVLTLHFDNLDISNVDILISTDNIDFDGVLTGGITLRDIYHTQQIEAEVEVKDFAFNKEVMGDATIHSKWNQAISALDINLDVIYQGNFSTHYPIRAKGQIYPGKRPEGNLDLDVDVVNYKLASLNPFMKGIASNIKGFANGSLKLQGTFDKLLITGELDLLRAQMKVDYLNVTYSFANKVIAEPNMIRSDQIMLYDSLGNTAVCDFRLAHDNFRNIRMNIDILTNKISALNTTYKNNNLFYGSAFASGNVKINGSFSDININIGVRPEANTKFYIPINLAVSATENSFIRFVDKEKTDKQDADIYAPRITGTEVDMNIQVNDNAEIQLFLPKDIGNIKGTGFGDIQMSVNKQGEMSMYGDYRMNQGSLLFTLGNIINRDFTIENGSSISFQGSPYDADLDISAIYKVKASLEGLSDQYAGVTIPVNCIIKLKNNLSNPDISFSIRLPEANNDLNQLVFSSIDTTNQVVMTHQIVSLLVMKSFAFTSSQTLATSVSSSSIDVLTNQLSNMLSQISEKVDIGVQYHTGNAPTDEEVEVALSTNLFNDRVSIDGNVGMYTTGTTQNASNIVGDVVVDVKITPDGRFRVKAFNKSNPFDISTTSYSAFKQGIGVYYRYEFDRFSDIFKRKKKKALITP